MKFKQQEETVKDNPFLKSVKDLITVCIEFEYAIKSQMDFAKDKCKITQYYEHLHADLAKLTKLYISLNPKHKRPELSLDLAPVDTVAELKSFEEEYYNMLKETGKNALELAEFEVVSYLSGLITDFKHYFCTLDENDNSGETSS